MWFNEEDDFEDVPAASDLDNSISEWHFSCKLICSKLFFLICGAVKK
jgi:hypothetical protein